MKKQIIRFIHESEIKEEYLACPFCGNHLSVEDSACCGETGHQTEHYELFNGEVLDENDFEAIIPDGKIVESIVIEQKDLGVKTSIKYREPLTEEHCEKEES